MAVKLPDTLVPMADFPSAFAKDVQFTDGENLQDKLDKGKLGSSSSGTGLTEEQANNIEKIPSIEGIVTSNSQAIENKADKDHEHTEYLTEIPDEYVTDTELSSKGYATETFVTNKIAEASLSGGDVDLSGYATIDDVPTKTSELTNDSGFITTIPDIYALKTDIPTMPTKTSQLTNDSGFVTSIPSEYITETELEAKGYLTEHQSLTDYAKKTDIPDVSDFLTEVPAGYVTDTKLSTELDKKVNKEVGKGLSTNDLTNELVTKINSSATEAFVTNAIANAQLDGGDVDLSGYATVDALNLKADLTHTHDQYLTKVPDEYITETELNAKGYLTSHQDISGLQPKTDDSLTTTDKTVIGAINEVKLSIPTRTSELENNSNFITNDDLPTVPTKVSDLENDSNFVTNSKMLEAIANAQLGNGEDSDIDLSVYQPIEESTLTTTAKTIPTAINELKSGLDDKVNKTDITTTIDSSSTDTQIPSAKATYDVIKTNVVGKETVLYEGCISTIGTITLADNVNDYDFIIINYTETEGGMFVQSKTMSKSAISKCISDQTKFMCNYGHSNSTSYTSGYFDNDKLIIANCHGQYIRSITGYKFGQITVANTITNPSPATSYSTDEHLTGGTWIDGKPIYRKVLSCTKAASLVSTMTWSSVSGWSDVLKELNIKEYVSVNFKPTSYGGLIAYNVTSNNVIKFWCMAGGAQVEVGDKLIIEYTKATDY